jgi:hypothetical protein
MEILDPTGPPSSMEPGWRAPGRNGYCLTQCKSGLAWPKLSCELPPRLVFLLLKEIDHHRRVIHRVLSDQEAAALG